MPGTVQSGGACMDVCVCVCARVRACMHAYNGVPGMPEEGIRAAVAGVLGLL